MSVLFEKKKIEELKTREKKKKKARWEEAVCRPGVGGQIQRNDDTLRVLGEIGFVLRHSVEFQTRPV